MKSIRSAMQLMSALLLLTCAVHAQAADSTAAVAEKRRAVAALMDNLGMSKMLYQMTDGMTQAFMRNFADNVRRSHETVTQEELKIAQEESSAVFKQHVPDILTLTGNLYEKYFTLNEIQELTAFYATSVGKKSIQVMPQLAEESMQQGLLWGQSLGPEIDQRIKKRVTLLNKDKK